MEKRQTPLEKLQLSKQNCKRKSEELELRLNDNFLYIQKNAADVLLSSFTSIIFPGRGSKTTTAGHTVPVRKNLFPLVWSIAKPMLVTWGIGITRSLFSRLLPGKKRGKK